MTWIWKKGKVVDITIFCKHEKAQYSGISSHLQCWNISNFAQCSASGDNEGRVNGTFGDSEGISWTFGDNEGMRGHWFTLWLSHSQ
jgi:hypothetical protein